ncbi:hypothetical protein THRCLA_22989, partial [Thraustotheca clavata]
KHEKKDKKDKKEKKQKKDKNEKVGQVQVEKEMTCSYCGSTSHVDSMCNLLFLDKIQGKVVKEYLEPKVKIMCIYCESPTHDEATCKYRAADKKELGIKKRDLPKERMCSYCFLKNHIDGLCSILKLHLCQGTLRAGYKMPEGQPMPSPADQDFKVCEFCYSHSHFSSKCKLLASMSNRGIYRPGYLLFANSGNENNKSNIKDDILYEQTRSIEKTKKPTKKWAPEPLLPTDQEPTAELGNHVVSGSSFSETPC